MTTEYDKYPFVRVSDRTGDCRTGWRAIGEALQEQLAAIDRAVKVIAVDCYQGVFEDDLRFAFAALFPGARLIRTAEAMRTAEQIDAFFYPDITADEVFGYLTRYTMEHFFDREKTGRLRKQIRVARAKKRYAGEKTPELVIVYGTGAAYLCEMPDVLVYADMARWEIQSRFRKNEISNIGVDNRQERASLQYKRAFFVDWRICDRHKKEWMRKIDFVLDTNRRDTPKMITGNAFWKGLEKAVSGPFRVVPFFDPGPWGGQWMKEVCGLDRSASNYAWCFDCVPEENSLLLAFGTERVEIPAIDVVFAYPLRLLGAAVYGRFGDEFPIRFDFLDTMGGGNLSLQVHPLTEYIQQTFGMHYTQDESYYLLDAGDGAAVCLGLKDSVKPEEMLRSLTEARKTGKFDAEKYVGIYPAEKHDHFLIPAGTVHCSGKNCLVLEISATPYIFTFKLWDWGRLGLDGTPRPIHIRHGARVIRWDRTESWVKKELIDRVEPVAAGPDWREEKTGLHELEFIETRRHWFSGPVRHRNDSGVNVLNLVEGLAAVVESPAEQFAPFTVHYAETFIIPATVTEYVIRPAGGAEGTVCATLKAFVRHHV